jgi:hypothetical protein
VFVFVVPLGAAAAAAAAAALLLLLLLGTATAGSCWQLLPLPLLPLLLYPFEGAERRTAFAFDTNLQPSSHATRQLPGQGGSEVRGIRGKGGSGARVVTPHPCVLHSQERKRTPSGCLCAAFCSANFLHQRST